MITGVDFSQWGGRLSQDTIECWKQGGVEFAVVQYSDLMREHLRALKDGGLSAQIYVYLYWDADPIERTRKALEATDGFDVKFVWLDAEDGGGTFTEAKLQAAVDVVQAAGLPCGIYTAPWWWNNKGGGSTAFSGLPLWHAGYVDSEPDFDSFQPYGGWARPLVWQWRNTHDFCGHSIDANVAESRFWEDDMATDDELRKARLRNAIIRTLLREDYDFVDKGPDPATGEKIVEVLSGVATDDAIRIRVR